MTKEEKITIKKTRRFNRIRKKKDEFHKIINNMDFLDFLGSYHSFVNSRNEIRGNSWKNVSTCTMGYADCELNGCNGDC